MTETKANNRKYLTGIIAILAVYVVNGCGSFENAAVQTMVEAWPGLAPSTIRLMVTLPSFTSMIVMTVIGQFVGRKISFKNCLRVGSLLTLFSGILPFFLHGNWYFILACRVFLGIGMGMLSIRSSMIILASRSEDQAKFIGYGAVVGSLVSASLSPVSGRLAAIGWYYPFLANLVVIVAVVMVFLFAREPEQTLPKKNNSKTDSKAGNGGRSGKIPTIVFLLIGAQFLLTMLLYPLLSGLSTYLAETGLGDAGTAGWLLSLYTGSGIFSNLCLKQFQKVFRSWQLPFFLMMPVLGLVLILFTGNIVTVAIGVFISGMGYITYSSTIQLYAGGFCDAATITKVSPILLAATHFGVFLSSYFIDLTSGVGLFAIPIMNPLFLCLVVYLAFAVAALIFRKNLYPYREQ